MANPVTDDGLDYVYYVVTVDIALPIGEDPPAKRDIARGIYQTVPGCDTPEAIHVVNIEAI